MIYLSLNLHVAHEKFAFFMLVPLIGPKFRSPSNPLRLVVTRSAVLCTEQVKIQYWHVESCQLKQMFVYSDFLIFAEQVVA